MSETDVSDLIGALRDGRMSLTEVAARFQRMRWPSTGRPVPATDAELAEQQDPKADLAGSYDDVTAAYDRGELTTEEYFVLSDAVAYAINEAARQENNASQAPKD
jgi:hypothetical protein